MKFREEDVDRLNNNLKIEEVVGKFIELKKTGANYKGLCPFHPDNSPSFMVNPSKNICKCFVCGAGGNPISFYSQYKKISYDKAIEELSGTYKIPIRSIYKDKKQNQENNLYYEIMEEAQNYFKNEIFKNSGRDALDYLVKRGIKPEKIREIGIGYAPGKREGLSQNLISKGYTPETLIKLGLTKENEKGIYDSFRERIIFPIYSTDKKIIAFGGRTLSNSKEIAKYINSPDTPIFRKGSVLYGLGEGLDIIKRKNYSILMEGYMDVIMSKLHGFDVTLAPMGTSLTEEQGKLLKRFTSNVIISFDSDAPGQKATERAIMVLKKLGFSIRVIEIKEAKDPDEYIKKYGKEAFLEVIKNSVESFDFLYAYYAREFDLNNILSKQNFIERFKEFFQNIENKIEKSLYIDKFSKNINLSKDILWESLVIENTTKNISYGEKKGDDINSEETKNNLEEENELEKITLALLISECSFFYSLKNKPFNSSLAKKVMKFYEENEHNLKGIEDKKLISDKRFTDSEKERIFDYSLIKFSSFSNSEKRREVFFQVLKDWLRLEITQLKQKKTNIVTLVELKKIENKINSINSEEKYEEIYNKFLQIIKKEVL
ncbi:MAG: DNA primase [Fusobacteriaceae bacterium]